MITIVEGRCTGCGLCARVCHEYCISVADKSLAIDHAVCSTCCQCIAVCPVAALAWDGMEPQPFADGRLPAAEQVAELLGQRRTVREFMEKKVDRSLLAEIAAIGVYAPTHNFDLRVIIVDDESLIEEVDAVVFRFTRRIYAWIYRNRLFGWLARLSGPAMRLEFVRGRPKLEHSLQMGRAYKSRPPALLLLVGEKRVPLSLASAQYALYNMNLYAMTRGVACRNLVGNQSILNRGKSLRRKLGLKKKEKIFAAMAVGWPALRFSNRVLGKALPLSWNGE